MKDHTGVLSYVDTVIYKLQNSNKQCWISKFLPPLVPAKGSGFWWQLPADLNSRCSTHSSNYSYVSSVTQPRSWNESESSHQGSSHMSVSTYCRTPATAPRRWAARPCAEDLGYSARPGPPPPAAWTCPGPRSRWTGKWACAPVKQRRRLHVSWEAKNERCLNTLLRIWVMGPKTNWEIGGREHKTVQT